MQSSDSAAGSLELPKAETCLLKGLRQTGKSTPGRVSLPADADLLFERHGRLRAAVEIKGKATVVGSDLRGLRSFGGAHPEVPRVVACLAPEPFRLEGVEVLPYARFLGELGRWLA